MSDTFIFGVGFFISTIAAVGVGIIIWFLDREPTGSILPSTDPAQPGEKVGGVDTR